MCVCVLNEFTYVLHLTFCFLPPCEYNLAKKAARKKEREMKKNTSECGGGTSYDLDTKYVPDKSISFQIADCERQFYVMCFSIKSKHIIDLLATAQTKIAGQYTRVRCAT